MPLFCRLSQDEAEKCFQQGKRHRNRKNKEFNLALAIHNFKEAIKLNPNNPKYHSELGRAYIAAPLLAISHGVSGIKLRDCLSLGIEELKEVLRLDPNCSEAYLVLGEAYRYLGEIEKAREAFQTVLKIPAISLIGDRLLKSYAKRELKQLEAGTNTQSQPEVAQEHLERAILYRDEKKYHLAELELAQALRLAPSWSWLYQTICKLIEGE